MQIAVSLYAFRAFYGIVRDSLAFSLRRFKVPAGKMRRICYELAIKLNHAHFARTRDG